MYNSNQKMSLNLLLLVSAIAITSFVSAQDGRNKDRRNYDSYDYCRQKAMDITGYNGRTPSRYRKQPKGALDGALKGAAAGAALGWITGGDSKEAAKKGAALGLILGGLAKAKQKEKEREVNRMRQNFRFELETCMENERRHLRKE